MTLALRTIEAVVAPPEISDPTEGYKPKKWHMTPDAERLIRTHYDSKPETIQALTKRLNVPRWTVRKWAAELGMDFDGFYTMRQMEIALGEDHKKIQRWVEDGKLKGGRRGTERKAIQGGDMWKFRAKDVKEFIRKHPFEISLKKVDQLWFLEEMVGILVGPE